MVSHIPQESAQNVRRVLRVVSSSCVSESSMCGVISRAGFGLVFFHSPKGKSYKYCFKAVKGCPFTLLACIRSE